MNLSCYDCANQEGRANGEGDINWCWYHNRELTYNEMDLFRNVPAGSPGYCRGFIRETTDAIIVMQ